jgi:N-acetylglucosamine-6-phosphate deacetylase
MTLLTNACVVTPDGVLAPGWLRVENGRIAALGEGEEPRPVGGDGLHPTGGDGAAARHDLRGAWVLPGFVDMHVHGGGGAAYTSGDPDEARVASAFHRSHGTTTTLASLVTAGIDELERAVRGLAPLVREGVLAGLHLEGPYLSPRHRGAHDASRLRTPDAGELDRLLAAAGGTVRMVTLAPELPGGLELVRRTVEAGAVAAIGHTDATYDQARAAFDAGARVATHLYNAMRPLRHRDPGPVAAALEDERVTIELINDGVHLHDAIAALAFKSAGAGRTAFITDAMVAAGMPDGAYALGSLDVEVEHGIARLAGGGSIAGSTLTMGVALRRAVQVLGLPITDAARAAATTPARVLGLETGALEQGRPADLVVLDAALEVAAVMARGEWAGEGLQRKGRGGVERTRQAWKAAPPGSAGIASGAAR